MNDMSSKMFVSSIIQNLFEALEQRQISYCHWKSNIRLGETIAGGEDIDILVRRSDAQNFFAVITEHGFKLAQSHVGMDHPGVFHAFAFDGMSRKLVHLHAYFQIVSGDTLVKNYRLQVEEALLSPTRVLLDVRVPTSEAELVTFAVRTALKHVTPPEIMLVNRKFGTSASELTWLRAAANVDEVYRQCRRLFPTIEPKLFQKLLDAIETSAPLATRIRLGWKVAWRMRHMRRVGTVAAAFALVHRVLALVKGRFWKQKGLGLVSGGKLIALVGPKATGKSTLSRKLASILGEHLDVQCIHAGKPPRTALTAVPRIFVPLARKLFSKERPSEYQKPEKRNERQYSLIFVFNMVVLAYERYKLLQSSMRAVAAGRIVISDRYPSIKAGTTDSSSFDDEDVAKCGSALKRSLMQLERSLYNRMPRPDLIVRLNAPIELTLERDATRIKADKPDADAVRRRRALESGAEFAGVPEVTVDTNRTLDETIGSLVKKVWSAL